MWKFITCSLTLLAEVYKYWCYKLQSTELATQLRLLSGLQPIFFFRPVVWLEEEEEGREKCKGCMADNLKAKVIHTLSIHLPPSPPSLVSFLHFISLISAHLPFSPSSPCLSYPLLIFHLEEVKNMLCETHTHKHTCTLSPFCNMILTYIAHLQCLHRINPLSAFFQMPNLNTYGISLPHSYHISSMYS